MAFAKFVLEVLRIFISANFLRFCGSDKLDRGYFSNFNPLLSCLWWNPRAMFCTQKPCEMQLDYKFIIFSVCIQLCKSQISCVSPPPIAPTYINGCLFIPSSPNLPPGPSTQHQHLCSHNPHNYSTHSQLLCKLRRTHKQHPLAPSTSQLACPATQYTFLASSAVVMLTTPLYTFPASHSTVCYTITQCSSSTSPGTRPAPLDTEHIISYHGMTCHIIS